MIAKKVAPIVVSLDCAIPVSSGVLETADIEQFFHDKIKVEGKTGNFEIVNKNGPVKKAITIVREGDTITVTAMVPMKKRYIKYLTKMYLAKCQIRDYIRVIATSRNGYTLKFFKATEATVDA